MFSAELLSQTADVLYELADGGRALEFAIGTGRVALPLAERGVQVTGIELSAAMIERLRAKLGGDADSLPVVIGDMSTAHAEGRGQFALVYLVFNTVMNLTTQDAQVRCFQNAANHLSPGGMFVVETMVPALRQLPPGERFVSISVTADHIGIDEYDVATQVLYSHHVSVKDGRVDRVRIPFRYAWPAELDLMAQMAGMQLTHRWEDWSRRPFTNESRSHISVWQKTARE
ncbi:MAG TPA: class I SAM-dependent methyltransferase [Actinomycetes bacterium]|nr:class I SAM-dependent methyltransferase [Actinomycetes bacterium]